MLDYTAKLKWLEDYRAAMLAALPSLVGGDEPLASLPYSLDSIAERVANQLRAKRQEMGID